ncbi:MAG: peptidylprolyl isomerase [candidate division Zixibacteria bacterium]|nr:peptidylprolyl isomerase [candidate division Zixibacteria bacterium]MDH3935774.1 peptidylprolyl isomerase [candidate division Zixibacteria bacterium]MDH4033983.1 peptidylprolyl isomerase [candidate division Zixibacteria bacterium]
MKSTVKAVVLVLTWALIATLSGCGGSGGRTVAVVDDYEISTEEFERFYPVGYYAFPSAQDEFDKKLEQVDSLMIIHMLVHAAYELGIDRSEELARVVLANKDRFLLDILYKTEVSDKATVGDTEVRDFWERLEDKIRASHIVVSDEDTAQVLFERLKAGESFEKIAYERSIDPSAKRNKGDLGYFTWGALVDEVQEVAFQMEPGELSPPVESNLGFHLIKLVDRLPNEQRREFKTMKAELEQQVTARKRYALQRDFFKYITEAYPVTIDTTTCAYLLHKREQMYPPQLLETLPRNDFDVEQLDRNERELVVGSWDGGQMTVVEYLEEIKKIPANVRPDLDKYDSLALVIAAIKRQDILLIEAHRRGLDSDPEMSRKLKLFKEYTMADMMRNDSLPKSPPPDDGVIRMYYDKHPDEFTDPATYHVYEILLADELKAIELRNSIKTEEEFREIALEISERPGKRALQGDLGYIRPEAYPDIHAVAAKTRVRTIGGPVVTRGKYSIFWVSDKTEPVLKDFLGVKRIIFEKISQQNSHAAFAAWVDERKQTIDYEVYEDALRATIDMDRYPDEEETGS